MNLRTITTRVVVTGATTALAAGALVGAATTGASAASATSDYVCTSPLGSLGTLPVTIDVPLLPPAATAGMPIAAGLLSYNGTVVVPAETAQALATSGIDGGNANDFTFTVGDAQTVAAPGSYTAADEPNPDGSVNFDGTGANEAFKLPQAGTYEVKLPATFAFNPTSGGEELGFSATCVTEAPATLGTVKLSKQTSGLAASSKKVSKGYKVTAKITNEYGGPTGKVVAKLGKKSVSETLKKGKAVFAFPKSAKGKTVKLSYKGDGYTQDANGSVKVG
jgi:hypothetical protein